MAALQSVAESHAKRTVVVSAALWVDSKSRSNNPLAPAKILHHATSEKRQYLLRAGRSEKAKSTQASSILITTKDTKQADILLQLDSFLEKKGQVSRPDKLNSVEGIAFATSLSQVADEEILVELRSQGVIGNSGGRRDAESAADRGPGAARAGR